jgi:hypothetical protein
MIWMVRYPLYAFCNTSRFDFDRLLDEAGKGEGRPETSGACPEDRGGDLEMLAGVTGGSSVDGSAQGRYIDSKTVP